MGAPAKADFFEKSLEHQKYRSQSLVEEMIEFQDYRPTPTGRDFSKHIADQITKGSSMCPFGSAFMGSSFKTPDFDAYGYDPNAPDSDDEPLSDVSDM